MGDLLDRLTMLKIDSCHTHTAIDAIKEITESRRCTERLVEAMGDFSVPAGMTPISRNKLIVKLARNRLASKPTVVCAEFHNGLKDLASRIAAEDHRPTLADAVNELSETDSVSIRFVTGDMSALDAEGRRFMTTQPIDTNRITTDQVEAMKADGVKVRFVDSIDVTSLSAVADPVNPSCRVIEPHNWDGSEPLAVGMRIEHGMVEALSDRDVCVRYENGSIGMYLRQNIKPIQDDVWALMQRFDKPLQPDLILPIRDYIEEMLQAGLITINGVK